MTSSQWWDTSWNPVSGCSPASAGCANCYAAAVARRFWDRPFSEVRCHPERLDLPLRWRKPRRVFVNSMSDLFHKDVPTAFLNEVFRVIQTARQHAFVVLTKRPERMRDYMRAVLRVRCWDPDDAPFPNLVLGVSAENQETADERIPLLLQTPAARRIVSFEPLLERITHIPGINQCPECGGTTINRDTSPNCITRWCDDCGAHFQPLDGFLVGAETGPKARPCEEEWIRRLVRIGEAAQIPILWVKQLSGRGGADMDKWPPDLRVRRWE